MAFACWRTDDLDTVLSLEALTGKEELFLATHFPIERLYVKKNNGDFHDAYVDQEALFAALVRERLHMFCVIEGITGCGKSHLIRWLSVQWKRRGPKNDVVLLLPRSGRNPGRMIGVLRDELQRLGFKWLSEQLTPGDDLTAEGRRESFLDRLATLLDSKNVQQSRAHAEWCDQKRIAEVLRSPKVREQWSAPARLIGSHTKEELPLFRAEEMWQLADLATHGADLRPVTRAALLKIKAEGAKEEVSSETTRLLEALNDRSRPALRAALGLNERVISEVFTELRRRLHESGSRLVILQEDITAAQGIDETLLDLFVSPAGMEGVHECPLVAVCGITPAYQKDYFNQTYGTRVTLHIDMSRYGERTDVPLSVVGTPERRRRFVARYLNGVRWSAAELRHEWRDGDAPPSRCTDCPERDRCHSTFGAEDGYGLYPLCDSAIERGFQFLTDRDDPALAKTPRNVLLGLLRPTLMLKKQVEHGRFPSLEVRSDRMREDVINLAPDVDNQIRAQAPEKYEQLRALIGLWGNGGATQTTTIDGQQAFAGVKKSVYQWFELPWIGTAPGTARPPKVEPVSAPPQSPLPPPTPTPTLSELDKRLAELTAWRTGTVIQSQSWWEDQVWRIVSRIRWTNRGISEWSGKQLLSRERIKLEGSKAGEFYLVIPCAPWAKEGLQAVVQLALAGADADFGRYGKNYLLFVDKICRMATGVVERRLESWRNAEGGRWNPLENAVQCLTVHSWVCGRITPRDTLVRHWHEILSYPTTPGPEFSCGREEEWRQLCDGNLAPLQTVHRFLDSSLGLLQGATGRLAVENAAEVAGILASFVESLQLSSQAVDDSLGNLHDLIAVSEATRFTHKRWRDLLPQETERLRDQAAFISRSLEASTLRQAATDIHRTLEDASRILPSTAAHELSEWAKLHGKLSAQSWWGDGSFENALDEWPGGSDDTPQDLLTRCISAPVDRLQEVASMLTRAEEALSALEDKVKAILSGDRGDPTQVVADIQREGEQLRLRAEDFKKAVEAIC